MSLPASNLPRWLRERPTTSIDGFGPTVNLRPNNRTGCTAVTFSRWVPRRSRHSPDHHVQIPRFRALETYQNSLSPRWPRQALSHFCSTEPSTGRWPMGWSAIMSSICGLSLIEAKASIPCFVR